MSARRVGLSKWQELAMDGWMENRKIKTRVQYYCADCGSFVSKDTLTCKTCEEKNDTYLSSNS